MTRKGLFVLAAGIIFSAIAVGTSFGDVRRERTERRPYIVEVGEPYSISMSAVEREADKISEMQEYVGFYGYPDYAEVQEIEPEWPWESYEVRLYYLQRNLQTDFGHVFISPAMPHAGVMKFRGDIPPEKRHQIEVILQARETPPPPLPQPVAEVPVAVAAPSEESQAGGLTEALVARIEAAAERAAQAADRAAEQSEAAVRAADRTVSVVEKMTASVGSRPR